MKAFDLFELGIENGGDGNWKLKSWKLQKIGKCYLLTLDTFFQPYKFIDDFCRKKGFWSKLMLKSKQNYFRVINYSLFQAHNPKMPPDSVPFFLSLQLLFLSRKVSRKHFPKLFILPSSAFSSSILRWLTFYYVSFAFHWRRRILFFSDGYLESFCAIWLRFCSAVSHKGLQKSKIINSSIFWTYRLRVFEYTYADIDCHRSFFRHNFSISPTYENLHLSFHSVVDMDFRHSTHFSLWILHVADGWKRHIAVRGRVADWRYKVRSRCDIFLTMTAGEQRI